ncbi:MAG TPA: MBL fold metallo-hydrolase [Chloroflexaceae bacterium]|nr:MBL fold metallo-hydrolase [Chloroflexaceae bacterium]
MHSVAAPARLPRGAHQVAPGVLRLRVAFVNLFFIGPPAGPWVLVDAGVGDCSGQIVRAAEAHYGPGAAPAAIILTHGHFDHVGALRALAERWDAPVYAHALELPFLTGRQSYPPPDPLAGEGAMAWLSPLYPRGPVDLGGRVLALPPDGRLPRLPGWRAIHTPGHTPGHISLFRDEDRVLIAGDAVVTTRQETATGALAQPPALRRPPAYFTPDWPSARRSVEALAALRPAVLASGHGPTLRGQAAEGQLAELAAHFETVGLPRRGRYSPRAAAPGPEARRAWPRVAAGALAGLAATGPMTAVMLALAVLRAGDGRDPFPPRQVMEGVAGRLGLWQRAGEAQRAALTLAGHFGYGAAMGTLYGARDREPIPAGPLGGAAYGLLVWAASYAGWLPALGIVQPPWREPRGRTLQLLASHLVWGATLGWLARRL